MKLWFFRSPAENDFLPWHRDLLTTTVLGVVPRPL